MARETLASIRAQRDDAIQRAERAERELIHLKALMSVLREIVSEVERVGNG